MGVITSVFSILEGLDFVFSRPQSRSNLQELCRRCGKLQTTGPRGDADAAACNTSLADRQPTPPRAAERWRGRPGRGRHGRCGAARAPGLVEARKQLFPEPADGSLARLKARVGIQLDTLDCFVCSDGVPWKNPALASLVDELSRQNSGTGLAIMAGVKGACRLGRRMQFSSA